MNIRPIPLIATLSVSAYEPPLPAGWRLQCVALPRCRRLLMNWSRPEPVDRTAVVTLRYGLIRTRQTPKLVDIAEANWQAAGYGAWQMQSADRVKQICTCKIGQQSTTDIEPAPPPL
jgi:hypothetical protein